MKPTEAEIVSDLGGESAVHPWSPICPACGSTRFGDGLVGSEGPHAPSHNVPFGTYRCAGCGMFWTQAQLEEFE